jgi:hypothetical protein
MLQKKVDDADWIQLAQDRIQRRFLVKAVVYVCVATKDEVLSIS